MRTDVLFLLAVAISGLVLGLASLAFICPRLLRLFRGLDEAPVYRPLSADELPEAAGSFFAERTEQLGRLGFRRCGDYRLRLEIEHFARLLVDASGTIGCELAYLRFAFWKCWRVTSMCSMLENLDCVETGDLVIPSHDGHLVVRSIAGADPTQLLDAHRALVAQLHAERNAAPIALDADSAPLVALYMGALMHESLHATGMTEKNAYAATLPEIRRAVQQLVAEPVEPIA
jgi:hypothetical protein